MTKTDAKRILRAYRSYARQVNKYKAAGGVDSILCGAAMRAMESLSDVIVPALNACGVMQDGAVLKLIDEALAG